MIVELSQHEVLIAKITACFRRTCARGNSVFDAQVGKDNPWKIEEDGFIAEMAFAKGFNLYPEFSVFVRSGGYDFKDKKGKKIDIKSTRYTTGALIATIKKATQDVDLYVLAIVNDNKVNFVGYATKEMLFKDENISNLGHGEGYVLPQDKLIKF